MKRRFLLRFALASAALYGCANVLGIDDIPVPDAADGGDMDSAIADGNGGADARTDGPIPDGSPVGADDGSVDASADANVFVVLDRNGGLFDPSAVAWDANDRTLFIANNRTAAGPEIAAWVAGGDSGIQNVINVPQATGERFGQLVGLPVGRLFVGTSSVDGGSGRLVIVDLKTLDITFTDVGHAIYGLASNSADTVYATTNIDANRWLVQFGNAAETDGTALSFGPMRTLPSGSVGVVYRTDGIYLALTSGAIARVSAEVAPLDAGADASPSAPDAVGMGSPAQQFMIDGPNGSLLIGTPDGRIMLVGLQSRSFIRPDGKPFQNLGAFAYDPALNLVFAPEGATDAGPGHVTIFTLPPQ